ncbi:hypothetical protein TNCV_3333671 [Trichonephila clavipes]|nr:hypothetical protein TNCV_3333671 [Trichonephila clavipes]
MWFLHFRHGQRSMTMILHKNAELVDIYFSYDLTIINGRVDVWLYGRRCPTRRQPDHQTLTRVLQNLGNMELSETLLMPLSSFRNRPGDMNIHRCCYDP